MTNQSSDDSKKIVVCKKSKELVIFCAICVAVALFVMIGYFTFLSPEDKDNPTEEPTEEVDETNSTTCPFLILVGDGYCDDEANTPGCLYDSGDCCSYEHDRTLCQDCFCYDNATINQNYSKSLCSRDDIMGYTMGDGVCDVLHNHREYYFDVGDCCLEDNECVFNPFYIDFYVDCQPQQCVPSNNYCIESELGDGHCQDHNNGKLCDYDLGDCCSTTQSYDSCCFCHCHDNFISFDFFT